MNIEKLKEALTYLFEEEDEQILAVKHSDDFKKFTDIEGVIIRGHILIEQNLNRSIELTVLLKDEYNADKFSFAQKVQIANMLGITRDFKIELNALNKLRNQIAHSLKYEEKYIDIVINEVNKKLKESHESFKNKNDKLNSLIYSISFMCGSISQAHSTAKLKFILQQLTLFKSKLE